MYEMLHRFFYGNEVDPKPRLNSTTMGNKVLGEKPRADQRDPDANGEGRMTKLELGEDMIEVLLEKLAMRRKQRDGRFVGTSNKRVATLLASETRALERFGAVVETVTNKQAEIQKTSNYCTNVPCNFQQCYINHVITHIAYED